MLTRHRRSTAIACLLFCTLTIVFSKFAIGQVGIAWDPSYAATNHAGCGSDVCGGGALGRSGLRGQRYNPLDFDSAEPNDEQRRVLFEFYNANRWQTYSADGIDGWDTSCNLNPLQNAARRRQSNRNLASYIGAGTMQIDPFMKRIYGGPTIGRSHAVTETMSSPLPPATSPAPVIQPDNAPPVSPSEAWPNTIGDDADPIDDFTEESQTESLEEFPTPEEYEDVAPEFEWDESLLDELPELNGGEKPSALPGNPLPPTSTGEINPLQAAIQLQSATEKKRGPVNPLQAAIALESPYEPKKQFAIDPIPKPAWATPTLNPPNSDTDAGSNPK